MNYSPDDAAHMLRALSLAERGRGAVEPNPCVGAVIVRGGRIVGSGFHAKFGGPHAEVEALAAAGEAAKGATLYVSLEPCVHFGKTPPCVDAVLRAGLAEVVAATTDPNPVSGGGLKKLEAAGMRVRRGVLEGEARLLNRWFYHWHETRRPYVTAKWAMTLDGKIATDSGDSKWVTSRAMRERMREERGRYQAIVVGIGTVLADNPRLESPRPITPVILDSRLRLPARAKAARKGTLVFHRPTKGRRRPPSGVEAAAVNPRDWRGVLRELGRRGVQHVLVEGGGEVLGSLFDAKLANEAVVCIGAKVAGGSRGPVVARTVKRMAKAWPVRDGRVEMYGDEMVLRYVIR